MSNNKKILIVCWSFPPNPGIGGRRWAKFAKYLLKEGYEVFVIKEQFNSKQINISQWSDGLSIPVGNIFEIKRHFLSRYLQTSKGVLGKIKHRISVFLLKILEKGTIYDSAVGLKKDYIKRLNQVISTHQIDKIIVTAAPFNLLYYTALAIKDYKNIISIADYRDPWLDAENYGMKNLDNKRKTQEINKQNLVFETYTYVTAPTKYIFDDMINQYSGNQGIQSQFVELKHAFDKDDLEFLNQKTTDKIGDSKSIKFIYGGTIYSDCEHYLKQFSDFIVEYNLANHLRPIEAIFYTPDYLKFEKSFPYLTFEKPIGNDIFLKLSKSDYIILLYANHNMNFKTTKFFEFMCLNKPFFYLGPKGDVANTIEKNRMGLVYDDINKVEIQQLILNHHPINNEVLISQNDFKHRTKELIQLLEH